MKSLKDRRISQKRITKSKISANRFLGHQLKYSLKIEALEKEIQSLSAKEDVVSRFALQSKEMQLDDLQQRLNGAQHLYAQYKAELDFATERNNSLNSSSSKK